MGYLCSGVCHDSCHDRGSSRSTRAATLVAHRAQRVKTKGPFKCYVMQWGMGGCQIGQKKCYEGVRFNLITVIRGCVGVKFPGKKRYQL